MATCYCRSLMADGSRRLTRRKPGSRVRCRMADSPAAPDLLTRPPCSRRPYCSVILDPLGSKPSSVRWPAPIARPAAATTARGSSSRLCRYPFLCAVGRGVIVSYTTSSDDVLELAAQSCALDEPAPAFASAIMARDLTPGRKGAITGPVIQRPLPCLGLQVARRRRFIHRSRPERHVPYSQARSRVLHVTGLGAAAYLSGEQLPRRSRANDGQAAITRPIRDGSATATLAARLASSPPPAAPTAPRRAHPPATRPAAWPTRPRSSHRPTKWSRP